MQIVSIFLLLVSTILIAQKKENKVITSNWWYSLIALSIIMFALRNGGLKVTAELGYDSAPVLFVAYMLSILFFLFPVLRERKKIVHNKPTTSKAWRIGLMYGMISGLCSYGGLQLYAVALQNGPANLVAPIFATNGLLVSLLSIIIYKERLNKLQWIAFLCLLLGLISIRITVI
jgi:drug/metabolite transporter (DMT)-like permease